jgi:hypothetical protein
MKANFQEGSSSVANLKITPIHLKNIFIPTSEWLYEDGFLKSNLLAV